MAIIDAQDYPTAERYLSIDSAPPKLARPLSIWTAPALLCVFMIVSVFALSLLDMLHAVMKLIPHPDLVFFTYSGHHSIPLRSFEICFYFSYAMFMDGRLALRLRFFLRLAFQLLLACGTIDLMNAIAFRSFGFALNIHEAQVMAGLLGLLIFAFSILDCGDMPKRSDFVSRPRNLLASWACLLLTMLFAGTVVHLVTHQGYWLINWMRENALLGGLGPGVFLFVPLISFTLYVVGTIRLNLELREDFAEAVTVIIPAYNESHIIARTLRAIDAAAEQHPGSVEVIVIDNKSKDDTIASARTAMADFRFCTGRVVEEKIAGKAYALNRGVAEARTPFILRIDADTQILPDAIRLAMQHFADPAMGVLGGLCLPPGPGTFDQARRVEVLLKAAYHQVAYGAFNAIVGIPGMFTLYRTEALRAVGSFMHGMNGEDTDVALRIGEFGYRSVVDHNVAYISEVPTTYAHLREQRLRWFRSIYHVAARDRCCMDDRSLSIRGKVVLPFMLMNTARRAMTIPILVFGLLCDAVGFNADSPVSTAAILATIFGAPTVTAILSPLLLGKPSAILGVGDYIVFRLLRCYFTLESALTIRFSRSR